MPILIHGNPEGPQTIQGPDFHNALTLRGTANGYLALEMHNNFAVAQSMYVHADAGFRSPYVNFYKSRGTESAPTPPTYTGYELDSLGGINFWGWDGVKYAAGAAIYCNNTANWNTADHSGAISIYGTNPGAILPSQIIQFGGYGPNGEGAPGTSIICFRPIVFGGAFVQNPGIFFSPDTVPGTIKIRTATNSADAHLSAANVNASGKTNTAQLGVTAPTVPASASAAGVTGTLAWDANFIYVCVATNTWKRTALSTW